MSHIRGRFGKAADKLVNEYTASIPFDWRLYPYDIDGSSAHARMLSRQGIISGREAEVIIQGLVSIREEIEQGTLSRSAFSHYGYGLAEPYPEVDFLENQFILIGKVHTVIDYLVPHYVEDPGIRFVGNLDGGVKKGENTFARAYTFLDGDVHFIDSFDRLVQHEKSSHKGEEGSLG